MSLPSALPARLTEALTEKGYTSLTDVQAAVLEDEAAARDLLVSAQTGSGKTVAFGLAMADQLLEDGDGLPPAGLPLALVIAPTRELALQVQRELGWLYSLAGGRLASCVGGMDARSERRALQRGAHIVVGTPGRLRDHIERGALDLSQVRAAVLDEADEMLDFGFREDLEFILDAAPEERRTLLFSATVSKPIADLARSYQTDALRLSTLTGSGQHADIEYLAHAVAGHEREHAVINVLRYHGAPRALVFCATRDAVNRLAARLHNRGFRAVALSGELSQAERTKALQALRDGRASVCVATDVAARGIDLPGLDLVVHAEPPNNAEALLHRSGRTGRAGAKGVSVMLVTPSRKGRVIGVLRDAKVQAQWTEAPSAEAVRERDNERLADHPALVEDMDPDRLDAAQRLLERFGAEQIAAAFLAELEQRLPAPEEISIPSQQPREPKKERPPRRDRSDFGDAGWFEVNLGRKHRAEPRWLVPMLCRVGQITGADIGAIRIDETRSRFQVASDKQAEFKTALSEPRGERDANVVIVPAGEALPERPASDTGPRPDRSRPDKPRSDKPRSDRPRPKRSDDRDRTRPPRKDRKPRRPIGADDDDEFFALDKAPEKTAGDGPDRPRGKGSAKPYAKPFKKKAPFKAKRRDTAPKSDWAPKPKGKPKPSKPGAKPGGATLKRVKRKKRD